MYENVAALRAALFDRLCQAPEAHLYIIEAMIAALDRFVSAGAPMGAVLPFPAVHHGREGVEHRPVEVANHARQAGE